MERRFSRRNNLSLGKDIEERTEKQHDGLPIRLFNKTTERKTTGPENFVYINTLLTFLYPIIFVKGELTLGLKDPTLLLIFNHVIMLKYL